MSLLNFFKFLEDKEGRALPGRAQFLDPNYVFNVEDFEDKDGNISLEENPNLISIPTDNLTVKGYLDLTSCKNLQSLPNNLTVGGGLDLSFCPNLQSLPDNLKVGGKLALVECEKLQSLPSKLIVGDSLDLSYCENLQSLPDGLNIGSSLYLRGCTSLQSLPKNLTRVEGSLDLIGCTNLQSLPDNLLVVSTLVLRNCTNLQSLPNNLTVGFNLHLDYTSIETLPKDLKIYSDVYVYNTPLAKKYTAEEIKQMCPGIKGDVYGAKGEKFK